MRSHSAPSAAVIGRADERAGSGELRVSVGVGVVLDLELIAGHSLRGGILSLDAPGGFLCLAFLLLLLALALRD